MFEIGTQYHNPRFTHLGGNANNGSQAGVFYWNVNNSSGNANRNIGSHVCPQSYAVKILVPVLLDKYVKAIKSLVDIFSSKNLAGGNRNEKIQ